MYYVGDATPLPVEIYRKELIDSGSREENKPTFDSFNVDEATDNINFFVYIYDRKERNIEKGMKLIAPNNHEFSTSSELRAEYHQLQIVGNLSGYGSWSYNIKRFFGNPQPHFIQVLAYPKTDSNEMIWASAFVRRPLNGGPNVVYAQVMQGNLPINDAFVEMIVIHNGRRVSTKQLFDNGSGEPDITRGDGVYSRYFAVDEPGMYTFKIFVTDNGNTAYTSASSRDSDDGEFREKPERSTSPRLTVNSYLFVTERQDQGCCGSIISTSSKQTVTPFQRYITPLSLFVSSAEIDQEKSVTPFIGRIGDLRWSQLNESVIIIEWSGPDVGRDGVKINYDIRYSSSLKDMLDDFETLANRWQYVENIPHIVGQVATVTINLADKPSLIGQPFFIAIKSRMEGETTGPISNVARVFVPKRRPTISPHFSSDSMGDSSGTDLQYDLTHDDDSGDGIFTNIHKVAGVNLEIIIPVVVCFFIIIVIIFAYCWCCLNRNKKFSKSKKDQAKSSPYQQPAISVIVPQTSPVYSAQKTQNQYIPDPLNSSMYYVEAPNHHTVGLPIDDEMAKIDYKEQEKMLYEEMRLQKQFQKQAMMEAYDHDMSMSANGTLTKDSVRYLSPVESWTASQLLHEHERRQSPTEIDQSSMYVDANGEIVPPIPPHPYQNNYGYLPGDMGRMPPPQYSYVYRPLARPSLDQGGSMQSVNASISAEKKIRNVTMV
jgi:calcium-activated chloride channel regulator 3/4